MRLDELQARFQYAIAPHSDLNAMPQNLNYDAAVIAAQIKPSSHLTGYERLEIYRSMVRLRLLGLLGGDFSGVRAVLGTRAFERIVDEYLLKYPPRSFSLHTVSVTFARFISEQKNLKRKRLLGQLADFEALLRTVAMVQDTGSPGEEHPLQGRSLEQVLDAKLTFNAVVHLVKTHYNVRQIRACAKDGERTVIDTSPQQSFYLICRPRFAVIVEPIDANEYAVLQAINQRKTLGDALTLATKKMKTEDLESLGTIIMAWFEKWSRLRIF